MLNRLAGVASGPLSTTKNISTLVAARIPNKALGLVFLMVVTTAIQLTFASPYQGRNSVVNIIDSIPILSAGLGPIKTSLSETSEAIYKDPNAFEEKIVNSTKHSNYPSVKFDVFEKPQTLNTSDGVFKYTKKLRVFATSYDQFCPGCSPYTASGQKAGYGVIAVDPNVIPLGTNVYVPGYGKAVAGDTGGAIKGAVVDLGFDNVRNGRWSSRFTDLYILE